MAELRFGKIIVEAEPGRDVLGALLDGEAPIAYICMAGSCGTCRVRVISGQEHLEPLTEAEKFHCPKSTGEDRLACQAVCRGTGNVVIEQ
jgi:ferredoxin